MNIYIHCTYIDISGKIFSKNTTKKKKLDPYIFVQKSPTPHERKKKHRPPAARQQKHSLHHKAVRHPSADSPRHAARHHSLCPCHVTPGPSVLTAWGGGGIPHLFYHAPKRDKAFLKGRIILWICCLEKHTKKIIVFFKLISWRIVCSPVPQVVFCEKIVDSHTCTSYIQKKQNFC